MSKFESVQTVTIQELQQETPEGSIPRHYKVHLKGSLVNSVLPGQVVDILGIYMT